MLSTLRVLRRGNLLSIDALSKANTAGIHICVKKLDTNKGTGELWRRNLPLASFSLTPVNFMSTNNAEQGSIKSQESLITEPIPEPPVPSPTIEAVNTQVFHSEEDIITFLEALVKVGEGDKIKPALEFSIPNEVPGVEPSFESLGLGGWTPVGMVENCMEFLHINCDLPWWGAIVVGTIVVRTLLFPLVILAQRNAAKMNNHLPEMQAIQLKMTDARQRGDRLDAARYAQELMAFMKEKDLNPFKNMLVPLAQAPLFISFFMGLRGMANLPVESLKTGGMFWFVDLTLPDQFYLLPVITSLTLYITIEVGTDAARMNSASMGMMKYFLRAMPVIIFPFTMGFPAAILVYWTSTNFISLLQVSFLKIPKVRSYFKIDPLIKHDSQKLPIKQEGFVKGVKNSWTNMKITRELEERERIDEINFTQAGRGAVKKTYKYDPTRPRPPRNIGAIEVKKRD